MSFLNNVRSYFQSVLRVIATAARLVVWAIGLLQHLLIGTFQWRAPGWLRLIGHAIQSAGRWVQAHRSQTALSAGVLVLLIATAVGGKWWYDSLPKPMEVGFRVTEPPRTRIEEKDAKPSPLVVAFNDSVAPLQLVGKDAASGVEMTPKLEGRWYWENDRTLKFDPKADWPVGGDFKVSLAQQGLVAEHVRLEHYDFRFKTAPFTARISQGEFYQDPSDPGMKKVVLTVTFSHPVDAFDFEKRVSMSLVGKGASLLGIVDSRVKFTVNYDKLRLNAYLHSEPLAIPVKDAELRTTVAADMRAAQGGRGTGEKLDRTVTIPGLYSLRVNDAQSTLVSNERFEPEQVLVLGLSAAVHEKEIQKNFTAYVLPVQRPDQQESERKRPYEWYDPAKIGPEILRLSQPLNLEAVPAEREYTEQHGFKYQADVGRYVYLKLGKGVKSFGGYVMGQDFDRIIRVQPFPPELKILHNGSLLAMSGERKLSVFARDIPGLRVEIGRLLPNQIQHLITQSNGSFGSPQFNSGNMDDSNLTERFTQVMELPRLAQGKPQYQPVDLGGYLDTGTSRRGVFLLKVESYDPATKRPLGKADRRLVLVTDLGLLVKKALDGSQDVFIQSIHAGAPLSGVTVEVIGKNGLPVLSQSTDGSGHVRFPDLKEFKNEQAPVLFLARRGGDMSFLPLGRNDRQLDLSRFDVGGVANTVQPDTLSAYLFSDRGIYRPGDEMHVGVIVKAADWSRKIAGIPLEAEVVDPRGLVVKRERLRLSASGFEELRFATQETSPTGNYTFQLYIVKDDRPSSQIGTATAKVQEFLPDRMKLSARLSAEAVEGWVSPQDLKARVNLQNLFGTPAAGRRVAAMLTLSPAYPSFRSFREFTFYDPQRAKEGFNERLAQGRTDEKGEAEFDLNLQRFAAATYRLNFLVQGYEAEGGRSVSAETATLVSSLPYLVGYKPDGDFGYVTRGAQRSVEIIAIDPQAKKTAVDKLTLAHIERKYVSVLTRQDSGTYKYESRKRETVLSEKPFAIPAAGARYPLATDEPGDYALTVRNAQGVEVSRIEYSIAGQANLTRSLEKNAELQITLNKKDYAPGEDIELQIKAPYTGAGLITIERDKVYQHTWFKSATTSTVQKIRLPGGFEGNGYVSVAFIRDAGSEEIYMSPLSYGVAPFSVSLDRRRVDVEVSVPDLVKPGEAFKIGYRTDKPTRLVVFAVDEGILQVAAYRTADPLGYFFQKRALDVKTAQILDLILPEFKRVMSLAAPGGDAEGAIGRNLNPFKRKRDKPVVFWSGILDAGPQPRDITYTVPDYFNGTLRVMAVAVSEGAVGVSQKTSLVRGDFVLSPNTPMVVAPGDEFEVSVGVANNVAGSGKEPTVSVTLATSKHLEVIGPAKADVKIGEMREGAATFKVRAREQLGSANLTFSANLNGKSARISVDASVRPAVPYLTQLTVGHFKDGHQDVPVTRNMHDEYRTLQAGVSHLPLGVAYGLVTYLGNFPYSCTEQLVSQGMPAVVLGGRPEFGHVKNLKGGDLAGVIETLRTRQNAEGAYGLWAANQHVSDFASVYAQHFLLEARERSLSVPQDMLTSGNNYLNQLAASEGEGLSGERVRAYAIYLLTRQGIITTNYASALQKRLEEKHTKAWQQDLAGVYLAASYQLMKQERLADGIIGRAKFGAGQVKGFEDYYDNLGRDAMLLYILSKHFPRRLGDVPPEALTGMVRQIQEGSYNTLSSAYVLLALDAYATVAGNDQSGKLEISEILKDGKARALPLPPGLMPRVDYSTAATKVRFSSDGDLTAFYVVTEAGFDRALPDKEIKSGLEVLREYTDLGGKAIAKVKLGAEIEVHLKFRAIGREQVANLAIVDLLPGGFEIVMEPRGGGEIEAPPVREPRHRRQQDDEEGNEGGDSEGDSNDQESPAAEPVRGVGDLPIGSPKSTWHPEYADVREDRIVLYGSAGSAVQEFVYRIKATNAGTYHVPPTLGESMYERTIRARSLGGTLTVERN